MSAVAAREVSSDAVAPAGRPRPRRRWRRFVLPAYTGVVILYLMSPILLMALYGFNEAPNGRLSFKWLGFSLDAYRNLFDIPDLTRALKISLIVAAASTVLATVLGTLLGLALVRYRFRGKGATQTLMLMAVSSPEIVMGASLLAMFVTLNVPLGAVTIILAHVMFNISYVAITVRARLAGFDRSLEEAAQDLGATPFVTFTRVTLPLIWPGVLAGALLAFALSLDDFVITTFVAGPDTTFPLWVYGASRVGIPPQVFAMGTLIFVAGVVLAGINLVLQRRTAKGSEATA